MEKSKRKLKLFTKKNHPQAQEVLEACCRSLAQAPTTDTQSISLLLKKMRKLLNKHSHLEVIRKYPFAKEKNQPKKYHAHTIGFIFNYLRARIEIDTTGEIIQQVQKLFSQLLSYKPLRNTNKLMVLCDFFQSKIIAQQYTKPYCKLPKIFVADEMGFKQFTQADAYQFIRNAWENSKDPLSYEEFITYCTQQKMNKMQATNMIKSCQEKYTEMLEKDFFPYLKKANSLYKKKALPILKKAEATFSDSDAENSDESSSEVINEVIETENEEAFLFSFDEEEIDTSESSDKMPPKEAQFNTLLENLKPLFKFERYNQLSKFIAKKSGIDFPIPPKKSNLKIDKKYMTHRLKNTYKPKKLLDDALEDLDEIDEWRLFVDACVQPTETGWLGFEKREPGYHKAMEFAMLYLKSTIHLKLSLDLVKKFHQKATVNVTQLQEDCQPGEIRTKDTISFGLIHLDRRHDAKARQQNNTTLCGLAQIAKEGYLSGYYKIAVIPRVKLVPDRKNNASQVEDTIAKYNGAIKKIKTPLEKLQCIIQLVAILERIHPFGDANCRTFCMLVFNRELIRNHFYPTLLEKPGRIACVTLAEAIQEVLYGMETFQQLTAGNLERLGLPSEQINLIAFQHGYFDTTTSTSSTSFST